MFHYNRIVRPVQEGYIIKVKIINMVSCYCRSHPIHDIPAYLRRRLLSSLSSNVTELGRRRGDELQNYLEVQFLINLQLSTRLIMYLSQTDACKSNWVKKETIFTLELVVLCLYSDFRSSDGKIL